MPKARPVSSPKPQNVEQERPKGHSTDTPCRYCGNDARKANVRRLRDQAVTFQVIVACSSCGARFAALSRN